MPTPRPNPAARRKDLSYRIGTAMAAAAWGMILFLFWQSLAQLSLYLEPPLAIVWIAAVSALFLLVYLRAGRARRIRARLRARSPGRAWKWVAATVPALALLPLALWWALLALNLAQVEPLPELLEAFVAKPYGEAALWLLVLLPVPLIEEFSFRGWIQRPLERGLGASLAVPVTAALFAIVHGEMSALPVRLAAGLVIGQAVYASRSVWTGVVLHVAWNGTALLVDLIAPDLDPTGRGWAWAAPGIALTVACVVWCAWTTRRMHEAARRGAGGPAGAARGRPVESA